MKALLKAIDANPGAVPLQLAQPFSPEYADEPFNDYVRALGSGENDLHEFVIDKGVKVPEEFMTLFNGEVTFVHKDATYGYNAGEDGEDGLNEKGEFVLSTMLGLNY